MEIIDGYALPMGISKKGNIINFSVEIRQGQNCILELYDKMGNLVQNVQMKPNKNSDYIFGVGIQNMDPSIVSYNYVINQEKFLDPYVKEVWGREHYGNEIKEELRGSIDVQQLDKKTIPLLNIPKQEVVAYRLHVRGYTMEAGAKIKHKGTFAGIVESIPYFIDLGINQLQLLPCYEYEEEGTKINYWGYTKGYDMAPKASYAFSTSESQVPCKVNQVVNEFYCMIQELHKNNIEVVLDMPFVTKPSLFYQIECLRYYVLQYQVDGFVVNPSITNLYEVQQDPILCQVKILTQNEEYQNVMRRYLKGDEGMVNEVIYQLQKPTLDKDSSSYNFITNHNGFTLQDLVSYDGKHNEENGEKNQDGQSYNYSWNCGVEGTTRKKAILELRKKQVRNAFTLLLLSKGTPCILAGDEIGNSQCGNNNAYCQDNKVSWINWKNSNKNKDLYEFVKALIYIRKTKTAITMPIDSGLLDYNSGGGIPFVSYHGSEAWMTPNEISSRQLGILYNGEISNGDTCYIAYNMHWEKHDFALPRIHPKKRWYQILDTDSGNTNEVKLDSKIRLIERQPRSIAVYICK